MVTSEVVPEAVLRNSVAVVAAALLPSAVIVIPRSGTRLDETAAHLPLVLWDAAMVDTAIGRAGGLDVAMIGTAEALLRSLRRSISRLLMLLLCGSLLRMLLLWGLLLLTLLLLLGFSVLLLLLLTLCVGWSNGSEKKEQDSRADKTKWFHGCCLRYDDFMRPALVTSGAVVISGGCLQ
jgi:hypothetical protein